MKQFVAVVVLAVCGLCVEGKPRQLPSYIKPCKRYDPQLEKCVANVLDEIKPHLVKGIPEMQIPKWEPLVIPKAELDTGKAFKATFENLKVYHAIDFQMKDLKVAIDENSIDLKIFFPKIKLVADYTMVGRILILELNGKGEGIGNLTNVYAEASLRGVRETRKNKEYIDFNNNKLNLKIGGPSSFVFENIIQGNQELSDTTNKIINDNIVEIIEELKPFIEETIASIVFGIATRVFKLYPLDTLLPIN